MKYVYILGGVAVLIALFAYFTIFYTEPTMQNDVSEEVVLEEMSEEVGIRTGVSTLESLRLWGEDIECNIIYKSDDQVSPVEGTYFVSDGNVRGDFLTESPDLKGQVLSSMILDGSMMYVWSEIEGETYGIKIDTSSIDGSESVGREPVDLDVDVDYSCDVWRNVDKTVFVPPGDVLFQDMGDLINTGMEYGTVYEPQAELP